MGFDPATVSLQVIAALGLAVRDTAGVPTYSSSLGDNSYAAEEITRAVTSAGTQIMQAVCETEGHEHRGIFTNQTSLTHAAALPLHYGPIGIPDITPYAGAAYTLKGKRKAVDQIMSYRANVNQRYSLVEHNASSGGNHSKLSGFYAIDNENIYFTGFSATAQVTNFDETDSALLPDSYHPLGIALAIANLKKDGDMSDIFSYFEQQAASQLMMIQGQKQGQPSAQSTIGAKDSGLK